MSAKAIAAGGFAGAVGAAVWAAIAYFANLEVAYVALGIGALVGFAVAATSDSSGPAVGGLAVVITVLALLVGKYASVELMLQHELGGVDGGGAVAAEDLDDDAMIASVADEIVEERNEAGAGIVLNEVDFEDEDAQAKDQYPSEVWSAASRRWAGKSSEDQQAARAELAEQTSAAMELFRDQLIAMARQEGFKASFGGFDLLFFGLAMYTAWGIGNGKSEGE
ncbi:MAG: hypothetical protein AAGB00_05660 [Planctomycetota bacterium]